jgi:hypothetical protein
MKSNAADRHGINGSVFMLQRSATLRKHPPLSSLRAYTQVFIKDDLLTGIHDSLIGIIRQAPGRRID